MKPLFILIGIFVLTLTATKITTHEWNFLLSGNIAMAAMLLFTAIGHFAFTQGMTMMIPDFVPFKKPLVYVTGLIEIAAAVGLLFPQLRHLTAVWLIVFFVLLLPANIHAATKKVDFQKATNEGAGLTYLWFRIPLQVFFIGWVWYFDFYLS